MSYDIFKTNFYCVGGWHFWGKVNTAVDVTETCQKLSDNISNKSNWIKSMACNDFQKKVRY